MQTYHRIKGVGIGTFRPRPASPELVPELSGLLVRWSTVDAGRGAPPWDTMILVIIGRVTGALVRCADRIGAHPSRPSCRISYSLPRRETDCDNVRCGSN